MNVTVIGAGYVGLVTGLCLTTAKHHVTFLDVDKNKCNLLRQGICPIYEPGASQLLQSAISQNLVSFLNNASDVINCSDVIFVAVNTPSTADGEADLRDLYVVIEKIAAYMIEDKTLVIKSTIPIGATKDICMRLEKLLEDNSNSCRCHVVFNPEFLREGSAVHDFFNPSRIILGASSANQASLVIELYESLGFPRDSIIMTTPENAELTKHASNSFLAIKLAYINELANLCEKTGAQITVVTKLMGLDERIAPFFMNAGLGFGGSCLPKDTKALAYLARAHNTPIRTLEAAINANIAQQKMAIEKILIHVPAGSTIAIWGLAFKSGSDDVRESPALRALQELAASKRYYLQVYDELAMPNAKMALSTCTEENVRWCSDVGETLQGVDALAILTAWKDCIDVDLEGLKTNMRGNYLFDFCNNFDRADAEKLGFIYFATGM